MGRGHGTVVLGWWASIQSSSSNSSPSPPVISQTSSFAWSSSRASTGSSSTRSRIFCTPCCRVRIRRRLSRTTLSPYFHSKWVSFLPKGITISLLLFSFQFLRFTISYLFIKFPLQGSRPASSILLLVAWLASLTSRVPDQIKRHTSPAIIQGPRARRHGVLCFIPIVRAQVH